MAAEREEEVEQKEDGMKEKGRSGEEKEGRGRMMKRRWCLPLFLFLNNPLFIPLLPLPLFLFPLLLFPLLLFSSTPLLSHRPSRSGIVGRKDALPAERFRRVKGGGEERQGREEGGQKGEEGVQGRRMEMVVLIARKFCK